jgi:hypothetical protein
MKNAATATKSERKAIKHNALICEHCYYYALENYTMQELNDLNTRIALAGERCNLCKRVSNFEA